MIEHCSQTRGRVGGGGRRDTMCIDYILRSYEGKFFLWVPFISKMVVGCSVDRSVFFSALIRG